MTLSELTTRQRTPQQGDRKPTYRAEIAQAQGPLTMGEPLDGSHAALHAVPWRLEWPKGGGLKLYQQQGPDWVEVQPGQAFPPMPDTARHITLTFDQSARHVVSWEDTEQIVVRQWDPQEQLYTYRGLFPGVDPLLFADTSARAAPEDSDVVLFHLTPDRTALVYRLQRDAYATEYPALSGLSQAVLDQVVVRDYAAQLLGEDAAGALVVDIGIYPLAVTAETKVSAGAWFTGGLVFDTLRDDVGAEAMNASGLFVGGFYSTNLYELTAPNAMSAAGAFKSGQYQSTLVNATSANAMSTTGAFKAGTYPLILVPVTSSNAVSVTGAFKGGSYVAV